MSIIKSERALKNPSPLRDIKEEARQYQQSFSKMRAHVLERAVPTYIMSVSTLDMQPVYSPEVLARLEEIKKMEDDEMRRFKKQVLDAGYDIEE